MEPIHQAAWDGDVDAIQKLVEEDGRRLNARIAAPLMLDGWRSQGRTPIMLAAYRDHVAAVRRLLALGADPSPRDTEHACTALHWACRGNGARALQLLLDTDGSGVSVNATGDDGGWTPLVMAASRGSMDCVALLLAHRGAEPLALDHRGAWGDGPALFWAVHNGRADAVRMLVAAGADPRVPGMRGKTPLRLARARRDKPCVALLEAAEAEPQRARLLLKARALVDAAVAVEKARVDVGAKEGLAPAERRTRVGAAAPVYLRGRVEGEGDGRWEMPRVEVSAGGDARVVGVVRYALGLEEREGMVKEVFVELCEMLVPRWDRANV